MRWFLGDAQNDYGFGEFGLNLHARLVAATPEQTPLLSSPRMLQADDRHETAPLPRSERPYACEADRKAWSPQNFPRGLRSLGQIPVHRSRPSCYMQRANHYS